MVLLHPTPMFFYTIVALVLGALFIRKSAAVRRDPTRHRERSLFLYSIFYLFALFAVLAGEKVVMELIA